MNLRVHLPTLTSGNTRRGHIITLLNDFNSCYILCLLYYTYRSMMIAEQWIDSIRGSGNCRLLTGLEKVQTIATSVDTLLIVMGSR